VIEKFLIFQIVSFMASVNITERQICNDICVLLY